VLRAVACKGDGTAGPSTRQVARSICVGPGTTAHMGSRMASSTTHTGYFKFITDWLDERYRQCDEAKRDGRWRAISGLSKQLVAQIRNRIRCPKVTWQPLRWCIRDKVTDAVEALKPTFHAAGLHKLVELTYPNHRLTLAHTVGDRLRLQATLTFLNDRVDHRLSPRCYGTRPNGTLNCTDRRTAVRRFQRLVWSEGNAWVAKLDVRKFYDTLPHGPVLDALKAFVRDRGCVHEITGYLGWYWEHSWPGHLAPPTNPKGLPQGSPVSAVLANIYMTSFDEALTAAGIEHIRFLNDVTIIAQSPEQLAAQHEFAMNGIEALGLTLAAQKTAVAYLGTGGATGESHPTMITLPTRGDVLPVHREFDELGVHFYADGRFRARHRTVNRLLSKIRRGRNGPRSLVARYLRATAAINRLLGYHVGFRKPGTKPRPPKDRTPKQVATSRGFTRRVDVRRVTIASGVTVEVHRSVVFPSACWISGVRYVQPRQHALLGHSDPTMAQMHRVDRMIPLWMRREFRAAIQDPSVPPALRKLLRGRRIRSAAKMFEMATREPVPRCAAARPRCRDPSGKRPTLRRTLLQRRTRPFFTAVSEVKHFTA